MQIEEKIIYKYSIKLLTKKDYSRVKLKKKLLDKGHNEDETDAVLDLLIERKYLREDYYIEARVKGLIRKNYSKKFIQLKMRQEGLELSLETISSIYEMTQVTEENQIEQLINKKLDAYKEKLKTIDDEHQLWITAKNKIINYLASKGHSYEKTEPVLNSLRIGLQ